MNLETAIQTLDRYRKEPASIQNESQKFIIEAFRMFWDCDPTEEEFAEHTNGINLQPEMLYINGETMTLTGMLMARPSGEKTPDGRELVALFGIVAAPEEMNLKEGHQFVVTGNKKGQLQLHIDKPIDRSEESRGNSPTGLLGSTIWRY